MLNKSCLKVILSPFFGSECAFKILRYFYLNRLFPYVQALTYHDTPNGVCDNLRNQLAWYQDNFVDCNLSDLRGLLGDGVWNHEKPGLIISFDDGLRSNLDVALPLLEEYGFTGWFMVPAGFIDNDPAKQIEFAKHGLIDFCSEFTDHRIALSWDNLREIKRRGHVVTCHSMTHKRLSQSLTQTELEVEIRDAKQLLEAQVGHTVDIFTWVGGEEWAYCRGAFELMTEVGIEYIFCTNCAPITAKQSPLFLERYHVEPDYSHNQLRFVLGGVYDLLYARKRHRIFHRFNA
jgi:peptidoglycan/xylan/chitin deacetylase (PgdA/CDA1 family)